MSRWRTWRVPLLCLLPLLATAAWLWVDAAQAREQRLRHEALLTARFLAAAVDRELLAIEAALRVLAQGRALADDDLPTLHREAEAAVRAQIVNNLVLSDRQGRQRLNTLRPWGSALPERGNPDALEAVFETVQPVVTDLFTGPVTGTPLVAIGVPVLREGQVVYSLSAGLSPDRLGQQLKRSELPEGWIVALVDGQGRVVARSHEAARFVGQPAAAALRERLRTEREGTVDLVTLEGTAVVGAFSPSQRSRWTVAVGAPDDELRRAALARAGGLLLGLLATGWLAWRLGRASA